MVDGWRLPSRSSEQSLKLRPRLEINSTCKSKSSDIIVSVVQVKNNRNKMVWSSNELAGSRSTLKRYHQCRRDRSRALIALPPSSRTYAEVKGIILAILGYHGSAKIGSNSSHDGMERHDLFHGVHALSREEPLFLPSLFPFLLCWEEVAEELVLALVQCSRIQMMMLQCRTDLMVLHSALA